MRKYTMQILHIFTLFVGIQILSFHAFAKEAVMSESTKQGIMIHNPQKVQLVIISKNLGLAQRL